MARSLQERLQTNLESSVVLHIHHFCALPTSTEPLFVAPAGEPPEPTELESHFLSVSVNQTGGLVQVFAAEVLIYSTEYLTTLFVSKADSTGYLHLLELPRTGPSPIQIITVEFLSFLIESKQISHRRLVLSLFARAQDQYLFPGSIENEKKHVLDDRGLIKWWAKLLDKALSTVDRSVYELSRDGDTRAVDIKNRAYIVVPGCDKHETRGFIPRGKDYQLSQLWHVGDPLSSFGRAADTPTRCLIPRFPDDPKARFAIDLDDELPDRSIEDKAGAGADAGANAETPVQKASDKWRSVSTLAQFWELMSFRQECSAGRLVGFLWAIWEPSSLADKIDKSAPAHVANGMLRAEDVQSEEKETAGSRRQDEGIISKQVTHVETVTLSAPEPFHGSITSADAAPQIQRPDAILPANNPPPIDAVKETTAPPLLKTTEAEITLSPDAYNRCLALLLTLDYCDLKIALESSKSFLGAVLKESGKESWGVEIRGMREAHVPNIAAPGPGTVNSLAGLTRKRPKIEEANKLSVGLIRKKPKP